MEISPILQNVLAPPVLFFLIGAISVLFKSDLEIPAPLPKLFSLYLLLAIGFKGGIEIQKSGFTDQVLPTLSAAILMSLVIPLIGLLILRFKFDVFNSAAIAAAYGSISAVTFISAESFLESQKFVNEVGKVSEEEGHHPDIIFGWGYAKINITTHAIEGLSENDFILAAKIDNITNV